MNSAEFQKLSGYIGQLNRKVNASIDTIAQLQQALLVANSRPRSVTEEIDAIPGRRIESTYAGEVKFTANDVGGQPTAIVVQVSMDGPFVMTHYPLVLWRPSAPTNATNFGRWRPVSSFPLPDQVVDTDIIDIMYELQDGGNQRLFQNAARGPLFSRPDNLIPCAIPTLWSGNSALVFKPTYNALTWDSAVAPTEGILHVDFVGYRIVNS